jgi:hypothetical protein
MTGWVALLDAMEHGLDSFPPVLVDGLAGDPGPVPPELVGRVERTLHRMAEVTTALECRQAEIGRELAALAALAAARPSAGAVPRFLDARA